MATPRLVTKTLSNGVRVAVVPDARASAVTAMVLVNVGSSFETRAQNGLSHFLEHMCFKGTVRRPSAKVIVEEIESLGAVTNAFTDRELTGYFIKGNPEHVDTFVDILADIYHHSVFPHQEIEKEKGVVVEEINMYEDMPQYKVSEILFEMLYPDAPAGRSVLGTKETVQSFTQKDFVAYKRKWYTAGNTLIVFSGAITPLSATTLTKKWFNILPASSKNKKQKVSDRQLVPGVQIFRKETDQAHMILAFRSFALGHKDMPIVRLLSTILGRGMSSRLSLIIREELGAAYYIHASGESYTDHGIFSIASGIDKRRLDEILERVVFECVRLKKEPLSKTELNKAKEYTIGTLRLSLETSDAVAEFYGGQMILGQKVQTPEQVISAIRKITPADILRVAKVLFQTKRANIALVGPFTKGDVSLKTIQKLG